MTTANNDAANNNTTTNTAPPAPPAPPARVMHRLARHLELALDTAVREGEFVLEGWVLSYLQHAPSPDRGEEGGFGWALRSPEGERVWESLHTLTRSPERALEEAGHLLWRWLTVTAPGGKFRAPEGPVPVWVEIHPTGGIRLSACEEGPDPLGALRRGLLEMGATLGGGARLRGWGMDFIHPSEAGPAGSLIPGTTIMVVPEGAVCPPSSGWKRLGGAAASIGGGYVGELLHLKATSAVSRWVLDTAYEIHAGTTSGVVEWKGFTFSLDNGGSIHLRCDLWQEDIHRAARYVVEPERFGRDERRVKVRAGHPAEVGDSKTLQVGVENYLGKWEYHEFSAEDWREALRRALT